MAKPINSQSVFGKRLREAREGLGIPQDKLGVMIGIDEGSSSARISRYETGVHEPAYLTAKEIASVLKVPTAYFYCEDDSLAQHILEYSKLTAQQKREISKRVATIQSS